METNTRPLYFPRPHLPEAQLEGPPAFLVGTRDTMILDANDAASALGLVPGTAAPPALGGVLKDFDEARRSGACLTRLRPPGALMARTFRCTQAGAHTVLVRAIDLAAVRPEAPAAGGPPRLLSPTAPSAQADDAPLRFTFETDADGRLVALSDSLADALGAMAGRFLGASLGALGDDGLLEDAEDADAALKAGAAFAGLRLRTCAPARLDLEIGAIPLFGAGRVLTGMRGFGIARSLPRLRQSTTATPPPAAPAAPRPAARLEPTSKVVPLRGATPLTANEQSAFQEIARTLSAAVEGWPRALAQPPSAPPPEDAEPDETPAPGLAPDLASDLAPTLGPAPLPYRAAGQWQDGPDAGLMDRLPVALLIQQDGALVHANATFGLWTGHGNLTAFTRAGGLSSALERDDDGRLLLATATGTRIPVEVRLLATPFRGRNALVYVLRRLDARATLDTGTARQAERAEARCEALHLVPWPVLLLEEDGHVLFANDAAARLLDRPEQALIGAPFHLAVALRDREQALTALRQARAAPDETTVETPLTLRTGGDAEVHVRAALSRGGTEDRLVCLVLAPEPAVQEDEAPPAPALPPPASRAETPLEAAEAGPTGLAHLARLLVARMAPALEVLLGTPLTAEAPPAVALPLPTRAALLQIRAELDDLAALATSRPPATPQTCDLAQVTRATLAHLTPAARRRGVRLRADLPESAPVLAPEPRVARLVRLMIADALAASPAGSSVALSLEAAMDGASTLTIADAGAPRDEVAEALARNPLAETGGAGPLDGADAPPRDDRLLGFARLVREAEALGGGLDVQRGLTQGLIARLRLPVAVKS